MKTTRKFERMAKVYKHFGRELPDLDWSDEAKYEMFAIESFGTGKLARDSRNGYFQGKRLKDITVAMWLEDLHFAIHSIPQVLLAWELYMEYPKWFIDSVLPKRLLMEQKGVDELRAEHGHLYTQVDWS